MRWFGAESMAAVAGALALAAAHAAPLPVEVYSALAERARTAASPVPPAPVRFRLAHLFDVARTPDLVFTELRPQGNVWVAALNVWGTQRSFPKGQIIQGIEILEVGRDRVTARSKGKVFSLFPRPAAPVVACGAIERVNGVFTAQLELRGERRTVRAGDQVQGMRVVDIKPEHVVCEYLGVRGTFVRFPNVTCLVSKPDAGGLALYVKEGDSIRLVQKGAQVGEARLAEVQPYHATFEYREQRRDFPCEPLPAVVCMGTMNVDGRVAVLVQGERDARRAGDVLASGARIDRIEPSERGVAGRVHLTFRGVPFDAPVR